MSNNENQIKNFKEKVKAYRDECEETRQATAEWWYKYDPEYAKARGFYLNEVDVTPSD